MNCAFFLHIDRALASKLFGRCSTLDRHGPAALAMTAYVARRRRLAKPVRCRLCEPRHLADAQIHKSRLSAALKLDRQGLQPRDGLPHPLRSKHHAPNPFLNTHGWRPAQNLACVATVYL